MSSARFVIGASVTALLALASPASAQWYAAAFLGANHTQSADVTIEQPGRALEFDDVKFEARPWKSPQYYGVRLGRLFGDDRRFGVEIEFIHLKVIARTDLTYPASGTPMVPTGGTIRMDTLVQRYAMTHGLNFWLANFVSRTPLGEGPFTLTVRGGAGPTMPHAETTVNGAIKEQYEYGGIGAHAAAGIEIRLLSRLSAIVDYAFTFARPRISLAEGTGQTTAASHQITGGLAFGLSR